jgi:hypothetical protein
MLLAICAMGLFTLGAAAFAQAPGGGTTTVTFTMPTGVDPPTSKFLNHQPIVTDASELQSGLNLYGRALQFSTGAGCAVDFQDINCIEIRFTSTSNVKVDSTVTKGLEYNPWSVTTVKSGNIYTITLCATAGSAPMSSWNVVAGQGFFAALTATKGGGNAANISNVTITPVGFNSNASQEPSSDLIDAGKPTIGASVDKPKIWSPNGKPVYVNLTGIVTEDQTESATSYISGIDPCSVKAMLSYTDGGVSSTPVEVALQKVLHGDGTVTFSLNIGLTAARNGSALEGRIYTFHITASDYAGNAAVPVDVTVTVTHDQSG